MADAYYKSKGIAPNDLKTKKSLREQYMGSTPSKGTLTGEEVIKRMEKDKLIRINKKGEVTKFKSQQDGRWYSIKDVDMSHKNNKSHQGEKLLNKEGKREKYKTPVDKDGNYKEYDYHMDAVEYWNKVGKYYGAKSDEVRKYMLNPNNYYLEHKKYNRSDGANLGIFYEPPEI